MQYRRYRIPGSIYFFTVNLADRENGILIRNINLLRDAFHKTKAKYPFKIPAYVFMPDHFHLLMLLPENDFDYSKRLSMIKSVFSKQIYRSESISKSKKTKRERGIWQRRFWEHLIRDEVDFENHVNYIHYNPVKHGYSKKASDWLYSSIHGYIQKGIIPHDWGWSGAEESDKFGE